MENGESNISVGTMFMAFLSTAFGAIIGAAFNRSNKQSDNNTDQTAKIAVHSNQISSIERSIVKLEESYTQVNKAMQEMVQQVSKIRNAVVTSGISSTSAMRLVEDIKRITEKMRDVQALDHELLYTLHQRVNDLENVINSTIQTEE